jgi:hypothetical protein
VARRSVLVLVLAAAAFSSAAAAGRPVASPKGAAARLTGGAIAANGAGLGFEVADPPPPADGGDAPSPGVLPPTNSAFGTTLNGVECSAFIANCAQCRFLTNAGTTTRSVCYACNTGARARARRGWDGARRGAAARAGPLWAPFPSPLPRRRRPSPTPPPPPLSPGQAMS